MGALELLESMRGSRTARTVPTVRQRPSDPTVPARRELPALPERPVAVSQELPAETRAVALERYRFVQLVEATVTARRMPAPLAVAEVAMREAMHLPALAGGGKQGKSALNYNNFRHWRDRLRKAGAADPETAVAALCDQYRRGVRTPAGDGEFWKTFFGCFLNRNRLPLTQAYRQAVAIVKNTNDRAVIPTLAQAQYRVRQLDPRAMILAREGEEALKNTCLDYIERDWDGTQPGDVVFGDTRTLDTRVKVWDEGTGKWRAVRPFITGLLDARSWYLASYWITTEPVNHLTLIDTLALYIHNTGGVPPKTAYFDNGGDYCARGFSTPLEVDGYQHSIFKELGIGLVNALPYNARAKTIERTFRDMMQQFDKQFPDYLGSTPGERTQAADYYDRNPEELPTLEQFTQVFAGWLSRWHRTPKQGHIHQGRTPEAIWQERPAGTALSPEQLRLAFLKPEAVRRVGRGPSITLGRTRFICDALKWGDRVLVKIDRLDPDTVLCCRLDGSAIGLAHTRERIKALALDDPEARRAIADGMARQRRQLKEAHTILNDLTGGLHQYSPLELFAGDAASVKIGSLVSVKGGTHHYKHHSLELFGDGTEEQEPPAMIAPAAVEAEEDLLDDQVRAVHEFIISQGGNDDDE